MAGPFSSPRKTRRSSLDGGRGQEPRCRPASGASGQFPPGTGNPPAPSPSPTTVPSPSLATLGGEARPRLHCMSLILKGPAGPGVTGNLGHGKEAKSAPEAEAEGRMCWAQPPPTASCRGSGWGPLGTSFRPIPHTAHPRLHQSRPPCGAQPVLLPGVLRLVPPPVAVDYREGGLPAEASLG